MKNALLSLVILLPLLTGCLASTKKLPEVPVLVSEEIIVLDQELLEGCKELPKVEKGTGINELLLEHYPGTIEMYGECANRQDASIKALKRLANIK